MKRIIRCLSILVLLFAAGMVSAQDSPCAVVLMHGKWGNPLQMNSFGAKLGPTCATQSIEMPWARRRNYDDSYPVALAQIKAEVAAFRQRGFARVLLAGHSFGANAALAYMAAVGDADGVIALAPGHNPEFMYNKGIGREAVDKARELVHSGHGEDRLAMDDLNQGQRQSVPMRADVLFSYFDPVGLGHMPGTAARFKKAVPFLWVIGTRDPLYSAGPDYVFNKTPSHPASRYLVVEADHVGTPEAAVSEVVEWIKGVLQSSAQ